MTPHTNTITKQEQDISDIFGDYSDESVETKNQIELDKISNLKHVIDEYSSLLKSNEEEPIELNSTIILNPQELTTISPALVSRASCPEEFKRTGLYLSQLIKNSYGHGNNEFVFDFTGLGLISNFSNYLVSDRKNKLTLTVNGDLGNSCGIKCSNMDLIVNGSVGTDFGMNSKDFTTHIKGDVGSMFGTGAKRMNAKIDGDVDTSYLSFIVMHDSKIYLTNEKTSKKVKKYLKNFLQISPVSYLMGKLMFLPRNKMSYIDENNKVNRIAYFV